VREGTKTARQVEGHLEEGIVKRVIAAAKQASPGDRVRTGLEAVIDFAETDPTTARAALSALRGDHAGLARLEKCLQGSAERATLALGAAIQVALTELASPTPNLRGRLPELERWLEGGW
jgi:hypothetical protein